MEFRGAVNSKFVIKSLLFNEASSFLFHECHVDTSTKAPCHVGVT